MKIFHTFTAAIALSAYVLTPTVGYADTFPNKPIKIIVPFAAGGQGDVILRMVTKAIEEKKLLEQPIIVSNVTGGGATIGIRQAQKAKADGYTLLFVHQTMMTAQLAGRLKFDYTSLVPIIETNNTCLLTATSDESGIQSGEDWISKAKANPKELKEATLIGSAAHYTIAMISKAANMKVGLVNIGGGSERVASILGNHTQTTVLVSTPVAANPKIKGLIYYGEERNPEIPDVPTAKELGYDVISCLDNVLWAPQGTPKTATDKLEKAFRTALKDPKLITAIENKGQTVKVISGNKLKTRLGDIFTRLKSVNSSL